MKTSRRQARPGWPIGLALLAAGSAGGAAWSAPAAAPFSVSCDGPFERNTTEASLKALFGAANVTHAQIDGPEGDTYPATVLFAKDASRTIRIVWNDDKARRGISDVTVTGAAWRGPRGLHVGATLAEIEKANGRAFSLLGFGWDYGGVINDWQGGALSADRYGCVVHARLQILSAGEMHAVGDGSFMSTDPKVKADKPSLAEFGLGFAD
jgi:hypothetical protein